MTQAPSFAQAPMSAEALAFALSLQREGYITLVHAAYAASSQIHFVEQGLHEVASFLSPGRTGRMVEVDVVRHVAPILMAAASKRIAASERTRERRSAEEAYTRLVHALSGAGGAPFQNPFMVGVSSSPFAVGRYLRELVLPLTRQFAGMDRDEVLEFVAAPVLRWCGWRHQRGLAVPRGIAADVESCVFAMAGGENQCDPDDFDEVWDATPRTT